MVRKRSALLEALAELNARIPNLDALRRPGFKGAEVRGPSGKVYAGVLGCLPGLPIWREPRRSAILMVESKWFDPLILVTILVNCCTMASESPLDPEGTQKEAILGVFEWVFLIIFTLELLSKVLAYSFFWHREAYLRDPWCQLDFLVVSLAWLPILFPSMGNYSVLRAFRALRPLRALKRVPGMPLLVQWILSVLPKMGNVLGLGGFVFLVFGIVGMELFKGTLHYRCALAGFEETPGHPVSDVRRRLLEARVAADAGVSDIGDQKAWDTGIPCNPHLDDAQQCPEGSTCAYFDMDPNHGLTSFDSVAIFFITFFQSITCDFWATSMYSLMAAFSPLVWMYFVLIIMVVGFFVINLFLAVIFLEYSDTRAQMKLERSTATSARSSCSARTQSSARSTDALGADGSEQTSSDSARVGQSATKEERATLLTGESALSDGTTTPPRSFSDACADCSPDGLCRRPFRLIANAEWLNHTSTALVLVNMVLMCMAYEGMSEEYAADLENAATVITWCFIIEMGIKLIGLGCAAYWADGWNCLDGTIVILSIIEMLVTWLATASGANVSAFRVLRMLRMLRVLRVLRLMRSWKGLYKIVITFIRALPQMNNLVVLMVLTMFMFALLGMQLLGGLYTPKTGYSLEPCPGGLCDDESLEEKPYYHFDYCGPAMITIFILLTGEWFEALEPAAAILGAPVSLFFIFVVMLGKFLLLNLLIAVILNEFAEESSSPPSSIASTSRDRFTSRATESARNPSDTSRDAEEGDQASHDADAGDHNRKALPDSKSAADADPPWPEEHALCCFGPRHPLRCFCRVLIAKPQFDQVIIAAIIVSSICLALDSPRLDPESDLAHTLQKMDVVFTGLFFGEMMTKVITFGFLFTKDAYLKSPWNQLDFCIVIISLILLLAESIPQLQPLRVLRITRVLRPLRLISRNAGMRLIITSLFKALPAVGNVFGVIFVLQFVFSVVGMQLFSGSFGSCSDPTILTRLECDDNYVPPPARTPTLAAHVPTAAVLARRELHGHAHISGGWEEAGSDALRWSTPPRGSFDDFGQSMLVLYVMSSGDSWEKPMWIMMGAAGTGHAAVRNDFSAASVYALAWMCMSYIFAINLFVGVVVDNFRRIQQQESGSATMTNEQQQWAATMKALANALPVKAQVPPKGPVRRICYHVITSQIFDTFITTAIIANIGVMACDFWGIEQDEQRFGYYNTAMQSFSYIYYIECILKMTAMGADNYFADNWCRFDFFLVCTSLLDQFASQLLAQYFPLPPMLLRVLRVLRILRILRLLKGARELRNLIVTMVLSFPALFNVGSLLCLILFIYAVLGVNLFTFVSHHGVQGGITSFRNFDTFNSAFLVLFQCMTGDDWSSIMADAMQHEESGTCTQAAGDCGSTVAVPFFISFQVLSSFIFLNLVVAVIIENFATLHHTSSDLVSASDLEMFSEAWAQYDPDATNFMKMEDVPRLIFQLPRPLGVKGKTFKQASTLCLSFKVPQVNGRVAFRDLLREIIQSNYYKSGADLDLFKEVVPGVVIPPLMVALSPENADEPEDLNEIIAMKIIEQDHVRSAMDRMRRRAIRRLHGHSTTIRGQTVPAAPPERIEAYRAAKAAQRASPVPPPPKAPPPKAPPPPSFAPAPLPPPQVSTQVSTASPKKPLKPPRVASLPHGPLRPDRSAGPPVASEGKPCKAHMIVNCRLCAASPEKKRGSAASSQTKLTKLPFETRPPKPVFVNPIQLLDGVVAMPQPSYRTHTDRSHTDRSHTVTGRRDLPTSPTRRDLPAKPAESSIVTTVQLQDGSTVTSHGVVLVTSHGVTHWAPQTDATPAPQNEQRVTKGHPVESCSTEARACEGDLRAKGRGGCGRPLTNGKDGSSLSFRERFREDSRQWRPPPTGATTHSDTARESTAYERRLACGTYAGERTYEIPRGRLPPPDDPNRWPACCEAKCQERLLSYPKQWVHDEPFSARGGSGAAHPPPMPPLRAYPAVRMREQEKSQLWLVPSSRATQQSEAYDRRAFADRW